MKKHLKKSMVILLCLTLVMSFVACQSTPSAAKFKAGTYEGTGKGIHGDIKLKVKVSTDKIENIEVVSHTETPGVSDIAFTEVPKTIIAGQTLAVDAIAGATYTSNGIVEGVTMALTAAGANIEDLTKKSEGTQAAKEKKELTTDVIVIGGGGAGLSAAVSAHQNGAKVIVLEKMPKLGGNTIISGAAYNAVDPVRQAAQKVDDSIDKHYTQTYEGGDKLGNPELIKVLVDNAYPTLEWLEGLGMKFKPEVFTVLGGMWPRAHAPELPLGTGFIKTYSDYIEKSNGGIEVKLNTTATEIIMDGTKAVGVKANDNTTEITITATKGVIIASGGFGANVEMRNEYNTKWADLSKIKTTNHPGATGDGITMGKAVGANLVGMEWIQLLPMGDPTTGSLSGNIEQGVENRIFVNKEGNRFVDEGARRDVMTKALFEQPDSLMWTVLDKHSYPTEDIKNHFNESIADLVAAGKAFKGETLEELAGKIGVNPANLKKSVEAFNQGVATGKDEFGRTLFQDKLDTPPYYAASRVPTVHHTMGGLQINPEAQVLTADGKIIDNLYAAGEVTGGIHGSNRLGGNALADINVFGRIAGKNAATLSK